MEKNMDLVNNGGKMDPCMKDIGTMIKLMEKEDLFIKMVTIIKEIGRRIRLMGKKKYYFINLNLDLEFTYTQIMLDIKESGKMINNMDLEKKLGLMELFMRENIPKDPNMERENLSNI